MKRLFAILATLIATPALAHHPLGGMPMETFVHGVLSGIGHPILGFDHLFFVVIVGVTAMLTGRKYSAPLAYIVTMLLGCLMMSLGVGLPLKETVIALSLLVVGYIVLSGRGAAFVPAMIAFAAFGLFHGSAFGDSIAAQEGGVGGAVLIGYMIGLGVIQYVIALASGLVMEKVLGAAEASSLNARLAGAAAAGVGLFLMMEASEGPALVALGLS